MEISCNLWKFCVTGVSEAGRPLVPTGVIFRPFGVGRDRSGSVGVVRGAGTFSGPIRAPEAERSELWNLCSTFMEDFHSQSCTGSIMEISCTLWKKNVNNRYFMEICSTLWKFVVLYGNFIALSCKKNCELKSYRNFRTNLVSAPTRINDRRFSRLHQWTRRY